MPRKLRPPRLEQDDNGRWHVRWFDPARQQTRRYSLGTADQAEATQRFARFLLEKQDADALDQSGVLTVGAALAHYWNERATGLRRDGSPNVIDHERIDIAIRNLELHFTGKPVADIKADDIKAYSQLRAAGRIGFAQGGQAAPKKVKDGTIRRELQCLVAALRWCQKTGRLGQFDFTQIDVGDQPEPRIRVLTREEWNRLAFIASGVTAPGSGNHYARSCVQVGEIADRLSRLYRFLMIGLHAPARRRTIERLMWTQVDFAAGIIRFNPPGARQSNKRKPTVPIADELRPVLERAFREKDSLYVLDHSGSIRTAFRTARSAAGLDGTGVTIHCLRHTYATWALAAGVPIWKVAQMLGDSVQTVERNYGHGHPEYLREAANFSERQGVR